MIPSSSTTTADASLRRDSELLHRTRSLLLGLAAIMFGALIVELLLGEHTKNWIQLIPLFCCAVGILSLGLIWRRPTRRALRAHRSVMLAIVGASLFGISEHLWSAIGIARDNDPRIGGIDLVHAALTSWVPVLAPGALTIAALTGLLATYGMQPMRRLAPPRAMLQRVIDAHSPAPAARRTMRLDD